MFYVSVSLEWNIENFRKKRQKVAENLLLFGVFCNLKKISKKSVGQKSLWIFAPCSKTDKRREQKQLLRK